LDNGKVQYIFSEMHAARTEHLRLTAVWDSRLQAAYAAIHPAASPGLLVQEARRRKIVFLGGNTGCAKTLVFGTQPACQKMA
jgi:hypothetical protein